MARVVVPAWVPGDVRAILEGEGHEVIGPGPGEPALAGAALDEALAGAAGLLSLLSLRVDGALLRRAPALRVVANYAVGYDNVDVAACRARGVAVTHTPDVLTGATADLTMALVLGCARRLVEGLDLCRSGGWTGWTPDQLFGLELDGARLGIVGMGRIGRAVARRAAAFGMRVGYWQPRPPRDDAGAAPLTLDELLGGSDVVSLHCPLSSETRGLLSRERIFQMKRGALLVNTARGPIVDEDALAEALEVGHLGGAGLDVYAAEPAIPPRLAAAPRALLLPHLGSATERTRRAMGRLAAEGIVDVLAGRPPRHPVPGS